MRFWESTSSMSLICKVVIPSPGWTIIGYSGWSIIPRYPTPGVGGVHCPGVGGVASKGSAIIGILEGFIIKLSLCDALLFDVDIL